MKHNIRSARIPLNAIFRFPFLFKSWWYSISKTVNGVLLKLYIITNTYIIYLQSSNRWKTFMTINYDC